MDISNFFQVRAALLSAGALVSMILVMPLQLSPNMDMAYGGVAIFDDGGLASSRGAQGLSGLDAEGRN